MPITWPDRYAPHRVAAHVRNEIAIAAPPAAVWAQLIRAADWPLWYPNASSVKIASGADTLSPDATFTWRTFGVRVRSTVREFVANERIAWDGSAVLLDVYHAWLIEPRGDGCWVVTEENQNGLAARMQAALMPQRMYRGHQLWLERLRARAQAAQPSRGCEVGGSTRRQEPNLCPTPKAVTKSTPASTAPHARRPKPQSAWPKPRAICATPIRWPTRPVLPT